MKNMPDTFSIDIVYKYLLSKRFYTVSGPFLPPPKKESVNIHRGNIFLLEVLSMLASTQIKTVKPPYKKPSISDRSSFLRRRSVKFQFVWKNWVTTFPWPGYFKGMLAYVIHPQNTKNPSCVCARYVCFHMCCTLESTHARKELFLEQAFPRN